MRGHLRPCLRPLLSEAQRVFCELSRHRRVKLARAARTTLVKADRWGRGDATASDLAATLAGAVRDLRARSRGA